MAPKKKNDSQPRIIYSGSSCDTCPNKDDQPDQDLMSQHIPCTDTEWSRHKTLPCGAKQTEGNECWPCRAVRRGSLPKGTDQAIVVQYKVESAKFAWDYQGKRKDIAIRGQKESGSNTILSI